MKNCCPDASYPSKIIIMLLFLGMYTNARHMYLIMLFFVYMCMCLCESVIMLKKFTK